MIKVIDQLIKAVRGASIYNPDIQTAPACILWMDGDRQWEAVIPRLQTELPELFVLGDYNPEKRSGPAIWLRCVIAGKINEITISTNNPPIFYLPGFSRQDLRAVESCPDQLKPLAELQYRGVLWSQLNAKDWTILAFLKSDQGGLGLDVAQDSEAKSAMQLALYRLLDEDTNLLKGKRLDKDYFNTLLSGGDPVRDLLLWLDQGEVFQKGHDENEWRGFVEVCKSQLAFNPTTDGRLVAAERLATRKASWFAVWERFCEAPKRYPNIPKQIRKCSMPLTNLLSDEVTHGGWPQWNEAQEDELRQELAQLSNLTSKEGRQRIAELEKKHQARRQLVWAELGESPLALALQPLTILIDITSKPLAAGTIEDMVNSYQNLGWKADNAVIHALSYINQQKDFEVVSTAINTIYLPWIEESARYLQKIVMQYGYPGKKDAPNKARKRTSSECILFVDGLRFDTAQQLKILLQEKGCQVDERAVWAALPSVTSTGKPAVSPVKDLICGQDDNKDFEPCVTETKKSLKGGYHLNKLLNESGWKVLEKFHNGDGEDKAWCEFGNIDNEGHNRGWKLAKHLDNLLKDIQERVMQLLAAGWKTIRIVTDHGWLLLPGGLPKTELAVALTESKWGRCAVIKAGVEIEENLYPWYWNPNQYFALADGVSCFHKGEEYAHGGLSLQECLTLELTVTSEAFNKSTIPIEITDVGWKGLRCTVAVSGECAGISLDIRKQPANPSTSLVVKIKLLKENAPNSVVIENEDLIGNSATIVLLDSNGELIAQVPTIIGGDNK